MPVPFSQNYRTVSNTVRPDKQNVPKYCREGQMVTESGYLSLLVKRYQIF